MSSSLVYSPSVGGGPRLRREFSHDNPLILIVKIKILDQGRTNSGKLAPMFAPLGISAKVVQERISELVKALNWSNKHITIRFIIKSKTEIDLELAENSPTLIISNLGEAPTTTSQYQVVHEGNLSFDQLINIAQTKKASRTARTLHAKVKEVLGTCVSIGCRVNGEDPRVILFQINNGTSTLKIPEERK